MYTSLRKQHYFNKCLKVTVWGEDVRRSPELVQHWRYCQVLVHTTYERSGPSRPFCPAGCWPTFQPMTCHQHNSAQSAVNRQINATIYQKSHQNIAKCDSMIVLCPHENSIAQLYCSRMTITNNYSNINQIFTFTQNTNTYVVLFLRQ